MEIVFLLGRQKAPQRQCERGIRKVYIHDSTVNYKKVYTNVIKMSTHSCSEI